MMKIKLKQSLLSAGIIVVISAVVAYLRLRGNTDKAAPVFFLVAYLLFSMVAGVITGAVLLSLEALKVARVRKTMLYNFICTLNILTGLAGLVLFLSAGFDTTSHLLPFLASLTIGSFMFYIIDK